MNSLRLTAACFLLVTLTASAQEPKADMPLTANPVYQQNCAKCHGKTAEGRFMAGPSLVSDKTSAISPDTLRNTIANGKHRMPKFGEKLSPPDIDALVTQIKAQQIEARKK
ncbi:MAG TPA: cytochrome c [Candidatus Dormibacteraeota bacterium]|nr:cytochrome c [Candidatus Dormibacteraeota bacterium]